MVQIFCKRCARLLRSQESIKRGYGLKCFKIMQLQKNSPEAAFKNEIDFLKREINMIKRQLKISRDEVPGPEIRSLKKINQDENKNAKKDVNILNFNMVIKELKIIFSEGDPKKTLVPISKSIKKIK